MEIFTASWFTKLPAHVQRIGISRGTPRGQAAGYRMYRQLAPGSWFNSVTPDAYMELFRADVLRPLNPGAVVDDLKRLAGDAPAVALLCFEGATDIHEGRKWCHRHLVASWLEDRLGITVPEFGFPDLDRFHLLRKQGLEAVF